MSHIHTEPGQHDHTASAYIVRLDFDQPKIILHLHKRLAKYMQFGGHVELDETPWQTIVREIKEETGYEMGQLKLLQPKGVMKHLRKGTLMPYPVCVASYGYTSYEDINHIHDDINYAFVTNEDPKVKLAADESDELRIFSQVDFQKHKDQIPISVQDIAEFVFNECLKKWEQIPALDI